MAIIRKFNNILGPATGGLARQNYKIDWSHPMARDLTFCVLLNSRAVRDIAGPGRNDNGAGTTQLSYQGLPVDAQSANAEELTPWGPGLTFDTISTNKLNFGQQQPIVGGGISGMDCTVLTIGNPASSATLQPTLFSQRRQSTFTQIDLIGNSSVAQGQSTGDMNFFLRSTTGVLAGCATTTGTAVDGKYHVYVGRIVDVGGPSYTSSIWVDGELPTQNLGTGVVVLSFFDSLQQTTISGLGDTDNDTYAANCTIPLVMTWNRALTNDEIISISFDPYQFIIPEESDLPTLRRIIAAAILNNNQIIGQGWM